MATNKNKAEEVLREAYDLPHMAPIEMCENMVNALEAAGLLAPDLPAYSEADVDSAWWYAATYEIGVGQLAKGCPLKIVLRDSDSGGVRYTDTQSAREYALMILAAADYAEKEQGNESR